MEQTNDLGRAPSGQALAVPATPLRVDGPSGFDPSREQIRREIINSPETADFMAGVPIEAIHQRERWGSDHDLATDRGFRMTYQPNGVTELDCLFPNGSKPGDAEPWVCCETVNDGRSGDHRPTD
jgi:hypothetical protein